MKNDNLKKILELTESLERVENNLMEENSILEFVLEHFTDGYWDWDVKKNYEYLSPKFKQQLGYKVHEMENKPESWMSICNGDDLISSTNTIKSLIKGDIDEFSSVFRFTHKKGHEVKILCRGKVVKRDNDGKALRVVGTHTLI